MRPLLPAGPTAAQWLRRAVVVIAAAYLLVLPQFSTYPSFVAAWRAQAIDPGAFVADPLAIVVVSLGLWLMPVLLVASWVAEGRLRLPHRALAIPAGLMVVGAVVSTAVASDKAGALVRAAEIAGLWAGGFALAQAIRSPGERRFLLAALVMAGVGSAAVAIHQAFIGFPQAQEAYLAGQREALGIEAGSWVDQMYQARFTGGVQAALGHPNVLAALLTLAVFVAIGLGFEKWAEVRRLGARILGVLAVASAVVCGVAIVLTQSRGAVAAVGVGAYWAVVAMWVPRGRRRVVLLILPLVLAALGLAVATQVDHPAVVSALATLRYRLDYWWATVHVLASDGHWATGVGLENFGHHYVQHKMAWAPEDVADPHNMFLSVWSTLGLAGLAALWLVWVIAVRSWRRRADDVRGGSPYPPRDAPPAVGLPGLLVPTMLLAAAPFVLLFILGKGWGVVGAAVVAFGLGLLPAENPLRLEAAGRPMRRLRTVAIVGLLAFALQEQIGTAILEPPTLWAMLVVLVVTLGPGRGGNAPQADADRAGRGSGRSAPSDVARSPADEDDRNAFDSAAPRSGQALPVPARNAPGRPIGLAVRFALILAAMALVFAHARLLIVPVAQERRLLRETSYGLDAFGVAPAVAAGKANPLAWEPAFFRAQLWHQQARQKKGPGAAIDLERAILAYRAVLEQHPRHRGVYLAMADCYLAMPGATTDPDLLEAARGCLESAAGLYPTHIPTRLRLARILDHLGRRPEALAAYREVLRLDGLMPMRGRGLTDEGRNQVRRRIQALSGTDPPDTASEPGAAGK